LVGLGEQHPVRVSLVDLSAHPLEVGVCLEEVLAVGALTLEQVRHGVKSEPVEAEVEPEAQHVEHRLLDLWVVVVEVGLVVEGLSFHVGSQCTNFDNYVQALNIAAAVMKEARTRGREIKILDIGGGFPVPYNAHVKPLSLLAKKVNAQIERLFAPDIEILAEPGRFLVATAATAIARVIGKAFRDGRPCYYVDDSVYHTFSGIIFDHCQYRLKAFKKGETEIATVFGQTCDGMDAIAQAEELPNLEIGDHVYSEDIGAYSNASSTWFNGFPPAKIVHVNM
jgi:ornithine decarboxylase